MKALKFCGDVWCPESANLSFRESLAGLVINLEAPITKAGSPVRGKICLKQDPELLNKAFPVLPVAACLANNHLLDYGLDGFLDTVMALERAGVRYFGAGKRDENYGNPLILEVDSVPTALMGYVCSSTHPSADVQGVGTAPLELNRIIADIELARERGAVRLIVSLHWGDEEVWVPKKADVEIAAALVNIGVDLVIGHHAHTRQPVYVSEQGHHVFFGIGNAMFPDFEYWQEGERFAWSKQRSWNRKSTLVTYFPARNRVEWEKLKQSKGRVVLGGRGGVVRWSRLPDVDIAYAAKFRRIRKFALARLMVSKMIAKPKIPSLRYLRFLAELIKS